jgi:hypothetical protein
MDVVLDLDLDFFVWPIVISPQWKGRAPEPEYQAATPEMVRKFLEQQCRLNRNHKLPGAEFVEHVDAFWTWKKWIQEGKLMPPFKVIHIDAHADIGCGDAGYQYLLSDVLALPVEKRSTPRSSSKTVDMNSGNYLPFAVANRWVESILYVYPNATKMLNAEGRYARTDNPNLAPGDLLTYHFRDFNVRSRAFQLKQFAKEDVDPTFIERRKPISVEPEILFDWISGDRFDFDGFTHMVVAQSPQYTSQSADVVLPVIRNYFFPC